MYSKMIVQIMMNNIFWRWKWSVGISSDVKFGTTFKPLVLLPLECVTWQPCACSQGRQLGWDGVLLPFDFGRKNKLGKRVCIGDLVHVLSAGLQPNNYNESDISLKLKTYRVWTNWGLFLADCDLVINYWGRPSTRLCGGETYQN